MDIGQTLKTAREAQQLNLTAVARSLGVRPSIITALEHNQTEGLGASIYARSYLRRYAKLLQLDSQLLDQTWREQEIAREPIAIAANMTADHQRHITLQRRRFLQVTSVFALPLLLLSGWYSEAILTYFGLHAPFDAPIEFVTTPASPPLTPSIATANAPPFDTAPVTTGAVSIDTITAGTDTTESSVTTIAHNGTTHDGVIDPVQISLTDSVQAAQTINEDDISSTLLATPEGEQQLHIVVNDDCWAEIIDTRGQKVFSGILKPSQTYVLSGIAPFKVKLGNVHAVEKIDYNQQLVSKEVYRAKKNSAVSRFILDADSLTLQPTLPTSFSN